MAEELTILPGSGRCSSAVQYAGIRLGTVVGYLAAVFMVVLSLSIILGIALRTLRLDNQWTYDVDLFALVWVAFVGASFTALRGEHVTSGVALENAFPSLAGFMLVLRFVIVAAFLAIFTVSGFQQFAGSVQTSETTLDVMSWPVWIPHLAIPVGTLLWLLFEIFHLARGLVARRGGLT